ncbi:hypothetical protein RAC89_27445 [Paenibacillus sp. GD4]|uniref:RCC1 domain-containing protein n=1 Tax=Paenibacillus sp. GD4 TaxID=3068890 RepID=UPI002796C41B|nr:hypothetical protein [Paenibacillus sp. GD4]MDQ1914135.1 hypothetical protein [Paenibacillus sp. GD4]
MTKAILTGLLIVILHTGCMGGNLPDSSPHPVGEVKERPEASASAGHTEHNIVVPLKPLGAAGEVASYYNRHLVISEGRVYGWTGDNKPQLLLEDAVQVGVGDATSYALSRDGRLLAWSEDPKAAVAIAGSIVSFAAGRTGVFAIDQGGTLFRWESPDQSAKKIADNVAYSSIGDGTDYYITQQGELYAFGRNHRGQYGNGGLKESDEFIQVASDVVQVKGHTGHAIVLKRNGDVQGSGGNLYGPLSTHGLGDKAVTWGTLFQGASLIATGSSHTVAVKEDRTLWIWGGKEGTTPRHVLDDVVATAAGVDVTIAKKQDGSIYFWRTGEVPVKLL